MQSSSNKLFVFFFVKQFSWKTWISFCLNTFSSFTLYPIAMSRQTSGDTSSHGAEQEAGPGSVYRPFQIMDDLLDKLKLLSYEKEFSAELRMRPLNRHYFVIQTNPGEQFFLFSSLAGWLIRKIGKRFDPPQEFDDPNSTIAYSGSFVPTSGYHWHFSYQVLMGSFYFEQGQRKYCLGKFWRRGGKNYTI